MHLGPPLRVRRKIMRRMYQTYPLRCFRHCQCLKIHDKTLDGVELGIGSIREQSSGASLVELVGQCLSAY